MSDISNLSFDELNNKLLTEKSKAELHYNKYMEYKKNIEKLTIELHNKCAHDWERTSDGCLYGDKYNTCRKCGKCIY